MRPQPQGDFVFILSCIMAAPDRPGSLSIQVVPWIDVDSDSGEPPQLFGCPSHCLHTPVWLVCLCQRLTPVFGPLVWDLPVKTAPQCPGEEKPARWEPGENMEL